MGIDGPSIVDWVAVLIALSSLWVSVRSLDRGKRNELFMLRQRVLLEAERARSAWYALNHENDALIHKVQLNSALSPSQRNTALEFLEGHSEHLVICIRDASALADDVQANVEGFSEKKCKEYLRLIEPSIEKLARNRGVSERKVTQLMERLASQPSKPA